MRFFAKSIVAILLAAVIAGLLTYPTWLLVSQFSDYRPDRVMRRVGMVLLAIALWWVLRREGLADRRTLGYGLPRRKFIRQMSAAFAAGLLLMLPIVLGLFGLNLREWSIEFTELSIAKLCVEGILTGFIVAFVEETFLRGAMFGVIQRESGDALAILLSSLLYAAVHFLDGKLRIPASEMTFAGGMQIAAHTFERFAAPLELLDSFAALFAFGVLLSLLRLRTGAIAASIGLHAGGVCIITMLRNSSDVNPHAALSWLVGSYDGVIGWMMLLWIGMVTIIYGRRSRASYTR